MKENEITSLAYNRVFNDTEWKLRVWWGVTYNRPILHDNIGEYTVEELFQEYLMHQFLNDEEFTKQYELENNIKKEEVEDEDREWFKEQMGEMYTEKTQELEEVHEQF